ncbi:MAG TPA: VTT domain-containing protein [Terriglobales bacterium]
MNDFLELVARHGYMAIFLVVFAEAIGLPMPAALALIAGGAASASRMTSLPLVLAAALAAMLLGDSLLFVLGRHMGWTLLGILCKVSTNPETCILRSAESFYKRGRITLLLAKFIPGINAMAPPLAGSMKMRFLQFVWLDLAGATLYAIVYTSVGFVFHGFLSAILHGFQTAGRALELVVLISLAAYIVYHLWRFKKNRVYRVVPRVQVEELARRLKEEGGDNVLLVDVRSHGYYDSAAARIKGSVRVEPNNLAEELKHLPLDKDIYVYCT